MPHEALIDPAALRPHLDEPAWALVDCRFDLAAPHAGQAAYLAGHIPGAVYAHLERDLSGPVTAGRGRHPLPPPEIVAAAFSRWGIDSAVQVVAYDDCGGGRAARLWWCLHWLGHRAAAVLDGGIGAWIETGGPLRSGEESRPPRRFAARPHPEQIAEAAEIERTLEDPALVLIDSRAPDRYRGEVETIDPVAGHIPGARNRPWEANLDARGRMLPPMALRPAFERLLGGAAPESAVVYCGSGVTACQNLLAMASAGLPGARLYPGSWSEWCADARRPVAAQPCA